MTTTERELQSLLLRLSVLLASSLATLAEPLPPTIIDPSSSSTYSADKLSAQILNDVNSLLASVQNCCTNLTLALKPSKANTKPTNLQAGESFTPTDGLDSASLNAAKAQLDDLTKDHIPKLTWLSRKASSEAVVYQYVAKTEEDLRMEKEERELVMSKGGHIVQQPHSREREKLEKIKGMGLGAAWSKAIIAVIVELQEALGEVSESFMSERTLSVLQKASEARAKASGQNQVPTASVRRAPKTRQEARQSALQATGMVWNVCDGALKGKLPKDNRIAVRSSWKARTGILEDALRELDDSLSEEAEGEANFSEEEDDDYILPETLSEDEKADIARYRPLFRAGCKLHAKVGELCLAKSVELGSKIDLDDINEAGDGLSEALDEMISILLYGEKEEGPDKGSEGEREAREAFVNSTRNLYLMVAPLDTDGNLKSVASDCEVTL